MHPPTGRGSARPSPLGWDFDEAMPRCLVTRIARISGLCESGLEGADVFGGQGFSHGFRLAAGEGYAKRGHDLGMPLLGNLSARQVVLKQLPNLTHLVRGKLKAAGDTRAPACSKRRPISAISSPKPRDADAWAGAQHPHQLAGGRQWASTSAARCSSSLHQERSGLSKAEHTDSCASRADIPRAGQGAAAPCALIGRLAQVDRRGDGHRWPPKLADVRAA